MNGYLLDTWAWIEFYEGSQLGEKIYNIIENEETVYTSIITLAELSDNYRSKNLDTDHSWKQIQAYVETHSEVIELTTGICVEAGKIKHQEREEKPDFGLMDAIILSTAKNRDLEILSGDSHLTDKKITPDLETINK